MQSILWIYVFFMFALGIYGFFKIKSYKDFSIAGAKQDTANIVFSLLATIIGSSATFGMVALVSKHGFPAFWWLGTGAIFLILQAFLLTKPVRNLNAYSLPHVASIVINQKAAFYISCIVCLTWVGIVAAQFIALSQIISIMVDVKNPKFFLILIGILVTAYTILGGQLSILKTDIYQFFFLFSSVFLIFSLLYFTNYSEILDTKNLTDIHFLPFTEVTQNLFQKFELFNQSFDIFDFTHLALVAGLAFFVGPDIFSRNLAAKNANVAQKATFIAAFILIIFACLMTYIVLWVSAYLQTNSHGTNLLIILITDYLPLPLAIFFAIGLISALISSADTCLMSSSIILGHDILGKKDIKSTRLFIVVLGLTALSLALFKDNIIGLLLGAYSVYVPGVVFPLAFSIYFHEKSALNPLYLNSAILLGSFFGIFSNVLKISSLSILGILISLGLCILSVFAKSNSNICLQQEKNTLTI